jgi:hypothetical protein
MHRNMADNNELSLQTALVIFAIVICWQFISFPFICRMLARRCGWSGLANKYSSARTYTGARIPSNGNNLSYQISKFFFYLGADKDGLHMVAQFPIKFGHPPLFIPWKECSVKALTTKATPIRILFPSCPNVHLNLSQDAARKLFESSGGAMPMKVAFFTGGN